MDSSKHSEAAAGGRNQLATLARLLALEREKRLTAERLVETERQALLQLTALLTAAPAKQQQQTEPSSAVEHNEDLLSTVLSQLPLDTQGLLTGSKGPAGGQHSTLALAMAAIHTDNSRQLEELVQSAGEEFVRDHGGSLLNCAVDRGHDGCVRVLLRGGCHPDTPSPSGSYPLLSAASNGHLECITALLQQSNGCCSLSLTNSQHSTALHLALQHGRQECANKLITAGAPLDSITKTGHTVLHAATITNMVHILRSLLAQLRACYHPPTVRQLVNHRNNHGYTALHEAAAEGFKECVQVLCASPEVDLSVRDSTGHTAADVATADCRLVITNTGCKEAVLTIETHNGSRCAVGRLHILPTHCWEDLTRLVELAIQQYFTAIQQLQTVSSNGDSSWAASSSLPGTTPRSTGKVPDRLAHLLKMGASEVCNMMEDVVKERVSCMEPLTLGDGGGVRQVRIGRSVSDGSSPYHALELLEQAERPLEVIAKLTGVAEGVLLSLTPLSLLEQCSRLLTGRRALLIHSTPSTDTAPVIKQLTSYLQEQDTMVVVKVPLYSGFSRDSLITLLHNKKLLHPPGVAETTPTTVLVMDGMERVKDMEEVFSELFVAMETKEGVWLDGVSDYPPGEYVLSSQCRIIATNCRSSSSIAGTMTDHFAHVRLSDNTEPGCGLLLRQLLSKLINTRRGILPMRFDGLYQSVVWVWRVWLLYNHFMRHLGLPSLTTGHKLFLTCPIETNNVDIVLSWLCELWNHSLVPKVEEGMIQVTKAHYSRRETARQLLVFMTTRVIQLTSPLSPDATRQLVTKLYGASSPPSPRPSPRDSPAPTAKFTVDVAAPLKAHRPLAKSSRDRVMDDSVKFQTLPSRGLAKRTSSFSGTLRKSLFGSPKQNDPATVKLRARDATRVQPREARMSYSGIEELKRSNKMNQLFDMLMDAGSHRLEEQRVPFTLATAKVPHHTLPVTSSDSSLKEPAAAQSPQRESKRVRSMSLDGSLHWSSKATLDMDCSGDDIFRPSSTSDLQHGSSPANSTQQGGRSSTVAPVTSSAAVTIRNQSAHSASLLYASTLGCFADSRLQTISNTVSTGGSRRRHASLSATAANMCIEAVEL